MWYMKVSLRCIRELVLLSTVDSKLIKSILILFKRFATNKFFLTPDGGQKMEKFLSTTLNLF